MSNDFKLKKSLFETCSNRLGQLCHFLSYLLVGMPALLAELSLFW